MIVDALKKTASSSWQLLPTPTSTSIASPTNKIPLPSVFPDPVYKQEIGQAGSTTLWVVFAIMVIASAVFAAWSWTVPVSRRLYHVITTLITIIAAISYFAMATGQGASWHKIHIKEQHEHVPDTHIDIQRQVFFARYVDWSLTTPLLLLDLGLLAGMDGAHMMMAIVADIVMILTGLFAAYGAEGTPQKWGWYAIACLAYLVVIWHLATNGRTKVKAKGDQVASFFLYIAGFTLLIWTAYPIVWGVADGSRILSVDGEIIAYAVLDVLAKPVFGIWLLFTHTKMSDTNIDLGGFWSNGLSGEGAVRLPDDDGA